LAALALAISLISASVFGAYGSPSSLSGSAPVILLILFLIPVDALLASSAIFFLSRIEMMQQTTTRTMITIRVAPAPAAASSLEIERFPIANASSFLHYFQDPSSAMVSPSQLVFFSLNKWDIIKDLITLLFLFNLDNFDFWLNLPRICLKGWKSFHNLQRLVISVSLSNFGSMLCSEPKTTSWLSQDSSSQVCFVIRDWSKIN